MDNTQLNNSSSSSAAAALFGMEMSPNCYLPTNFEDPNDPFESALSSMVSSPTSNPGGFLTAGDGMMIRELIGRLGTICDSGEISPQSCIATASNTPLNSPPKFSLSSLPIINQASHPPSLAYFNGDPGFAERAAKFSPFGRGEMVIGNGSGAKDNLGDSREGSSVSHEQNMNNTGTGGDVGVLKDSNSRKRKSISKAKVKESPSPPKEDKGGAEAEAEAGNDDDEESKAKRSKTDDVEKKVENRGESNDNNNNKSKDKEGNSNSNNSNNKETAKPEPPKDYIHVRARRGQATDSHSLAERVRREKISERMKFLQDLVPGCNKVTGKATVLDEIINYVQSLQRQVEFLSMKLATVNPRMDFNMEALLSKDMWECRGSALPQTMYTIDQNSAQAFPFGLQPSQQLPPTLLNGITNGAQNPLPVPVNPVNANAIHRSSALQVPSMSGLTDPMIQLPTFCDDDLQSIVQMGISQNLTQTAGASVNAQMKVEL